jgi:hypothetical protein
MDIPVLLAVLQAGTITLEAIIDSIENENQKEAPENRPQDSATELKKTFQAR